jgi:putative molybdopterin biosynthesis protein
MVLRGNPREINSLADLARKDVTFVNRQRGSGTRILLDYHLRQMNLPSEVINGYDVEEYTHLAVAAAVASGRADCGLGIPAAADALGLEFIPLFHEQYDLVIPYEHAVSPLLAPIFDLMASSSFRNEVAALPGYEVTRMGQFIKTVE